MVLVKIFTEATKIGIRAFRSYYKFEGKAFDRLYTGFRQSKTIGRGVRHGLTAGSTIGSLIAPDSPGRDNDNGFPQQIQQRKLPQTNQPYKTRRRSTIRYSAKCRPRSYNRFRE